MLAGAGPDLSRRNRRLNVRSHQGFGLLLLRQALGCNGMEALRPLALRLGQERAPQGRVEAFDVGEAAWVVLAGEAVVQEARGEPGVEISQEALANEVGLSHRQAGADLKRRACRSGSAPARGATVVTGCQQGLLQLDPFQRSASGPPCQHVTTISTKTYLQEGLCLIFPVHLPFLY